jgi:hypothetical protein
MADPTGIESAASYGISEALLATHPELRAVYELFKAGNTGKALEELFKTEYYKTFSTTVKAREKQKLEQRPVYDDNVQKYRLAAQKRLVNTGIKIDTATFNSLVENAYAKGMSDDQLDQAIAASGKITGFGGNILGDTTTLKTYAASFGVNSLLNDAYWTSKQTALFQGTVTTEDIQKEIRDLSASAFPAYADGIANGVSMSSQASNVLTSYATFLEKDLETVDFNNATVRKITQYVDPVTGKPARMPQWMVEKTIKSDPEWGFTKNGQKSVDDLTLKVSNDWFGGAR